jgi:outer membrane protein OmpA-like peptidoglycan-associated protein
MVKRLVGTFCLSACLGVLIGCAHEKPADTDAVPPVAGTMQRTDPAFLEGKGKLGTCQGDADCAVGEFCHPETERCNSSYPNPRMLDMTLSGTAPSQEECKVVRLFFPYDSTELVDEALRWLQYNVRCLKSRKVQELVIEGYADSRGPKAYNQKLSVQRGEMVRGLLQASGITLPMKVVGYGEKDPLRVGRSEKDYAFNRRVEFTVK